MSYLSNLKTEPYNKGDWYKVFIESNGSERIITTSDLDGAEIISDHLMCPKDFHVVQFMPDINGTATGSDYDFYLIQRYSTDNRVGFMLPDPDVFDYMDLYIFGYQT